jgi:hypothetical protein
MSESQIQTGGIEVRKKSVLLVSVGVLLLAGGLLISVQAAGDHAEEAPPQVVILKPTIHPEGWVVEPSQSGDQGDAVNGIVRGPSGETEYRCVVLLEPIQPGEQFSKASEPVCSRGSIDSINGVSLDSLYLIAKFYDRTDYRNLLVEYYGAPPCSPTISYGVTDLDDSLDNKFASGRAYSNCDHIYVYDFNDYGEPIYSCGANCPSFYALNDEVSSWRTTD